MIADPPCAVKCQILPMPTPSDDALQTSNVRSFDHSSHWSQHATCPIEEERTNRWRAYPSGNDNVEGVTPEEGAEQQPTPPVEAEAPELPSQEDIHKTCGKSVKTQCDGATGESMSPLGVETGSKEIEQSPSIDASAAIPSVSTSSADYEFSDVRVGRRQLSER